MRKSPLGFSGPLLILTVLCLFALIFYQKALLTGIQWTLNSNRSLGLPTSTTPIPSFSFPTVPAPVSVGKETIINNLGITVTGIVSPADKVIGAASKFNVLEKDEEYLLVYIKTRCVSKSEKCRVTEFDFGVHSAAGRDYTAELSGNFSDDLKGVFEGGDIPAGQNLGGSLIFIIRKGDHDLTLVYPRLFSFGNSAEFLLGK